MAPDLHLFRQPTTIGVHDSIDASSEVVLSPIPARRFAVFTTTMPSEISPGDPTRSLSAHFLVFVDLHIREGGRPRLHQSRKDVFPCYPCLLYREKNEKG